MKHLSIFILILTLVLIFLIEYGVCYDVLMILGGMYIENGVRYTHR